MQWHPQESNPHQTQVIRRRGGNALTCMPHQNVALLDAMGEQGRPAAAPCLPRAPTPPLWHLCTSLHLSL